MIDVSEWPLDPESYREDDLYYASVTTGYDLIEVEVPPDPEDDESA